MEEEYHIKFPKADTKLMDSKLTFSIDHIRSREVSALYFIITFYDMDDTLIYTYKSARWIIDTIYKHKETTFTISNNVMENSVKYQIELVAVGISSENPLYFNDIMFQNGEFTEYHRYEDTSDDYDVKFNKNSYANLYDKNDTYLQVIRPNKDKFMTNLLNKSNCTILAPHFNNESSVDNATNVYFEFVNQTEQRIDILR